MAWVSQSPAGPGVSLRRLVPCILAFLGGRPAVADVGAIANVQISRSGQTATIDVRFTCANRFLGNLTPPLADHVDLNLSRTDRCDSPVAAGPVREATRPPGRDMAALDEIEYVAKDSAEATLRLRFDRPVTVTPVETADPRALRLLVEIPEGSVKSPPRVETPAPAAAAAAGVAPPSAEQRARADAAAQARLARPPPPFVTAPRGAFAINLESATDFVGVSPAAAPFAAQGQKLYVVNVKTESQTWYQLRLGFFATERDADVVLKTLQDKYPQAWVAFVTPAEHTLADAQQSPLMSVESSPEFAGGVPTAAERTLSDEQIAALMEEARLAMLAKDYNKAIELYTEVLHEPAHASSQNAQEFLGLARDRSGQIGQAMAEYRHYLVLYPEGEDADRVRQRLIALTTARDAPKESLRNARQPTGDDKWNTYGSFSQYYRRDSSQISNQDGWLTQSAVLSDGDFVARYRGDRFDFATRTTAAYRYNIDDVSWGSDDQTRVYNMYVDLQDRDWGLGGRLGRQTLRTGGVLGMFDGAHLSWQAKPDIRLNINTGYPVYYSADGVETDRVFYGGSVDFTHVLDRVDASVFYNTQTIDGVEDRQAVGGEVRYFDEKRSLFGTIDYDIGYNTVNTFNLVGNWTFDRGMVISASADYRRRPFLTTENATNRSDGGLGRWTPEQSYTEDQIRQLAEDRSGKMLTYTLGLSQPLAQRWQVNGISR